jgi:hypothetical protein
MRHPLTESKIMTAFWAAVAVGWLILGNHSDRVPWGSELFWVTLTAVAAGAALAVARYRTVFALRSYVFITTAIGAIRSCAYLSSNAGGPAAVWFLFTLTNLGGYLLYVDRLERRK